MSSALPRLDEVPVIGIVRRCPPGRVVAMVGAAARAGITVVEITLDSPEALTQIESVSRTFPDLVVGAGTVIRPSQLHGAVDAGARFVVSPVARPEMIDVCVDLGVPCLPGAATPTEIVGAWEAGATAVKVFPAATLGGPAYVKAIRAPLEGIPLIPTGGVGLEAADDYLEAGAIALGVGGDLFPSTVLAAGDVEWVEARAARWVEVVSG